MWYLLVSLTSLSHLLNLSSVATLSDCLGKTSSKVLQMAEARLCLAWILWLWEVKRNSGCEEIGSDSNRLMAIIPGSDVDTDCSQDGEIEFE